jgi:hypothetical protein
MSIGPALEQVCPQAQALVSAGLLCIVEPQRSLLLSKKVLPGMNSFHGIELGVKVKSFIVKSRCDGTGSRLDLWVSLYACRLQQLR